MRSGEWNGNYVHKTDCFLQYYLPYGTFSSSEAHPALGVAVEFAVASVTAVGILGSMYEGRNWARREREEGLRAASSSKVQIGGGKPKCN